MHQHNSHSNGEQSVEGSTKSRDLGECKFTSIARKYLRDEAIKPHVFGTVRSKIDRTGHQSDASSSWPKQRCYPFHSLVSPLRTTAESTIQFLHKKRWPLPLNVWRRSLIQQEPMLHQFPVVGLRAHLKPGFRLWALLPHFIMEIGKGKHSLHSHDLVSYTEIIPSNYQAPWPEKPWIDWTKLLWCVNYFDRNGDESYSDIGLGTDYFVIDNDCILPAPDLVLVGVQFWLPRLKFSTLEDHYRINTWESVAFHESMNRILQLGIRSHIHLTTPSHFLVCPSLRKCNLCCCHRPLWWPACTRVADSITESVASRNHVRD